MENIKEKYDQLKKKCSLPDFDSLDNDFEISLIDHDQFLLREIRRKMLEKLEFFIEFLEEILQPETTISNLHECRVFEEKEKEKIFEMFKAMMILHRQSLLLSVESSEKDEAAFISNFSKEWSSMKPELKRIIVELSACWKQDTELNEELGYLG
jgi:hypothetical protein